MKILSNKKYNDLISKQFRGIFADVNDDNLLRENGLLYGENKELKQEIERLNNIINEVKQQLLNKKDIVEKSKYFKLVYYTDWNMEHEWDKSIVDKIDEIINIIDEENK